MHSHQMDWFWHDQIKISVNLNAQFECNVGEVKDAKTRLYSMKSMSDLRDFSAKPVKTG